MTMTERWLGSGWDLLTTTGKVTMIRRMINDLKTGDYEQTQTIVQQILLHLTGPEPETDINTLNLLILALGEVRFPELFQEVLHNLFALLTNVSIPAYNRKHIALQIGHLGRESTIDLLERAYPLSDDFQVKEGICQAVSNIGGPRAYDLLTVAVIDMDPKVRAIGWQNLIPLFRLATISPTQRIHLRNISENETDPKTHSRSIEALNALNQYQGEM